MLHRLRAVARDDRGFTLVEMFIVVILIGILSAIAIPSFLRQKEKAVSVTAVADVVSVSKDVLAAQSEGALTALSITTSGSEYVLVTRTRAGIERTPLRLSPGNVPSVTLNTSTDRYCVTVRSNDGTGSVWSAGNSGLREGPTCA